jgi:hypothetical protein
MYTKEGKVEYNKAENRKKTIDDRIMPMIKKRLKE